MNINFYDDSANVPKPRHLIKVERLEAAPYPDQTRLRVSLETSPFTPADRPNVTLTAFGPEGEALSSLTVIETLQSKIDLTLHLKQLNPEAGEYTLRADLYFEDDTIQHSAEERFILSPDHQEGK